MHINWCVMALIIKSAQTIAFQIAVRVCILEILHLLCISLLNLEPIIFDLNLWYWSSKHHVRNQIISYIRGPDRFLENAISHLFLFTDASEFRERSRKNRKREVIVSWRVFAGCTTVVCLISSHYVSTKTASRTAEVAVLLDSKKEKPGIACVARMYATHVADGGSRWRTQAQEKTACPGDFERGWHLGDVLPILRNSQGQRRSSHAETFPGYVKIGASASWTPPV